MRQKMDTEIPIPTRSFCDYIFDKPLNEWKIGESYLVTIEEFLQRRKWFGLKPYRYSDKYSMLNNIRSTANNAVKKHSECKIRIYQNQEKDGLRIWRIE